MSTLLICLLPSHHLNLSLFIVNWALRDKRRGNLSENRKIFIEGNALENAGSKMAAQNTFLENVFQNEYILKFTDIIVYLTIKLMFCYHDGGVPHSLEHKIEFED